MTSEPASAASLRDNAPAAAACLRSISEIRSDRGLPGAQSTLSTAQIVRRSAGAKDSSWVQGAPLRWKVDAPRMPHSRQQRLKAVQEAIFARNSRRALFPGHLFADPAWDILLVLYAGALEEEHCGLDALATTGLPTKNLLSWIDALVGEGLVASTSDRPAFFRLTLTALSKMETFFSSPADYSHC